MKRHLSILLALLLSLPSMARDFQYTYEGQTLTYTVIDEDAKTCKTEYDISYRNSLSDDLIIPEIAVDNEQGYTVIKIGPHSFAKCRGLKSVSIPNSVTEIGEYAFDGCDGLTSVSIPKSVTDIGVYAFKNCSSLKAVHIVDIQSWLEIKFGGSTDWIGGLDSNPLTFAHHLYVNDVEVKDLTIPSSTTCIYSFAFSGCSGLTSVSIPESVRYIRTSAFDGCEGLTSLTIPNSVTRIERYAFKDCNGLTSLTIPETVTDMDYSAFDHCSGIETLYMYPKLEIDISSMSSLKNITINKDAKIYDSHLYDSDHRNFINFGAWQTTQTTASIRITKTSATNLTLKIIDDYGKEVSYIDATKISCPDNVEGHWDGDRFVISNLYPNQKVTVDVVGLESSINTKDVNVKLSQTSVYADMVEVTATIDAGDFKVDDYYWTENESHELSTNIPWGENVEAGFVVKGKNYEKQWNITCEFPLPEFSEEDAVATALNKARLTAKCNLSTGTVAGIEWRRSDAPEDVKSNVANCPVVAGIMMGELRGLRDDVYYKYRPFYKRGEKTYYGEWVGFYTGDAGVYFEPEVGTLPAHVGTESVSLEGYAFPGTDDISASGIEYRSIGAPTRAGGEWQRVEATSGTYFKVNLEGLDPDTEYEYRTYAVAGEKDYYGDTATFTTLPDNSGVKTIPDGNDATFEASLLCNTVNENPQVRVFSSDATARCVIYNLNGSIVYNSDIVADGTLQSLNANLTKGMYLLNIVASDGRASFRLISK